jgi:hypothetical protein
MIRVLCAVAPLLLAVNPPRLPAEKDPCQKKCEDEFQRKSGSCHSKSCFSDQLQSVKECSQACGQKRQDSERMPMCTTEKGKKVPCSQLRKPQPAR